MFTIFYERFYFMKNILQNKKTTLKNKIVKILQKSSMLLKNIHNFFCLQWINLLTKSRLFKYQLFRLNRLIFNNKKPNTL